MRPMEQLVSKRSARAIVIPTANERVSGLNFHGFQMDFCNEHRGTCVGPVDSFCNQNDREEECESPCTWERRAPTFTV